MKLRGEHLAHWDPLERKGHSTPLKAPEVLQVDFVFRSVSSSI